MNLLLTVLLAATLFFIGGVAFAARNMVSKLALGCGILLLLRKPGFHLMRTKLKGRTPLSILNMSFWWCVLWAYVAYSCGHLALITALAAFRVVAQL